MHDLIRLNFELSPDFMVVLITCKNEEDPTKYEGGRVFTTLYINFSDAQGQITPGSVVVSGRNLNCKNEDDSIKMEGARVVTTFFSRRARAANSAVLGSIWPNFKLVVDVMDVLVTCKNKEDPNENESTRVVTRFSPILPYGSYLLPWKPEF